MIPLKTVSEQYLEGIPRESGDDPVADELSEEPKSYSPRERG